MTNRYYQKIVSRLRESVTGVFGIVERNGTIAACSDESQTGRTIRNFVMMQDLFTIGNMTYHTLLSGSAARYAVFVNGTSEECSQRAEMLAGFFDILIRQDEEQDSRTALIRRILFEETDTADLYDRLKQMNINNLVKHEVICVRCRAGYSVKFFQTAESLLARHDRDFVLLSDQEDLIAVRETGRENTTEWLEDQMNLMEKQYGYRCAAGISEPVDDLIRLPSAYRQAEYAMHACMASDPAEAVCVYGKTGYAGVIGTMSEERSRAFLKETDLDEILGDREMLFTIRKFLECNLDITETAKELYINRNTLVYRFNKIQKNTGLDLRRFEDAMMVKTVLMVRCHLGISEE